MQGTAAPLPLWYIILYKWALQKFYEDINLMQWYLGFMYDIISVHYVL